jgi:putative Mn2+ efflux pump MntP
MRKNKKMLPETLVAGCIFVLAEVAKVIIGFFTLKFLQHWWNKWFKKKPKQD